MSADELGESFGKYRLLRRLAFGGMAEIFLAAYRGEEGFEKRLVLKRILPQFGADPSFVRMFIDEAVLAARLTHTNIVQIFDFGSVEGVYFIAMEWVDGADLRRLIRTADDRGRPLSAPEVAAIGEAMARGLSYAHAALGDDGSPLGLVHRDVSPHNVMVSRTGEVKVMDFGIAKAAARASHTATGTIKGKVAYMAPEQASGGAVDGRADQFALGLVLWECLTGRRLFQGDSDLEVLRRVVSCETRPVSDVRADVPADLEAIVMRALAPSPEDRYPTLADVADALAAFRFSLGAAGAVSLGRLLEELAPPAPQLPALGRRTLPLDPSVASVSVPSASQWEEEGDATALETRSAALRARDEPPKNDVAAATVVAKSAPNGVKPRRRIGTTPLVLLALVAIASAGGWALWRRPAVAATSAVAIDSTPPGAHVLIDQADTGLTTPTRLPALPRGVPLRLRLSLAGYASVERTVVPQLDEERVQETLEAESPKPSRSAVAAPPQSPVPPAVATPKRTSGATAPRAAKAKAPIRIGYLSLRSTGPWFEVYLGGRKLGETPLQRIELPEGKHVLRLVSPATGDERSLAIEVTAGEELRRTITVHASTP